MNFRTTLHLLTFATAITVAVFPAVAQQDQAAELAKQTQNPLANLISVPIKIDYNSNMGPTEQGNQSVLTVEPVIPFSISADWNLISRTLITGVREQNLLPGAGTQQGLGDTTAQLYFSPKKPTDGGWILGGGPQFLLPTGNNMFSAGKWGAGPAFVALRQESGWTYGALVNQTWSISNDSHKSDYSTFFVQPFLAYTFSTHTTPAINSESTYNWKTRQWSAPINLEVSQILKFGKRLVSLEVGVRYWADTPDGVGPKNVGYRMQLTLLFPESK